MISLNQRKIEAGHVSLIWRYIMNACTNSVWYPTNVTVVPVLEILFDNLAGTFCTNVHG